MLYSRILKQQFTILLLTFSVLLKVSSTQCTCRCLEIWNLFLVLTRISHSFTLLTRNKYHISAHPYSILYIFHEKSTRITYNHLMYDTKSEKSKRNRHHARQFMHNDIKHINQAYISCHNNFYCYNILVKLWSKYWDYWIKWNVQFVYLSSIRRNRTEYYSAQEYAQKFSKDIGKFALITRAFARTFFLAARALGTRVLFFVSW